MLGGIREPTINKNPTRLVSLLLQVQAAPQLSESYSCCHLLSFEHEDPDPCHWVRTSTRQFCFCSCRNDSSACSEASTCREMQNNFLSRITTSQNWFAYIQLFSLWLEIGLEISWEKDFRLDTPWFSRILLMFSWAIPQTALLLNISLFPLSGWVYQAWHTLNCQWGPSFFQ